MPLIRPCLVLFTVLTVLTGVVYPLAITSLAQVAFPDQAQGSLIRDGGRIVGSRLIGQAVSDPGLFWSRPSATTWDAANSGGANRAPVTGPQRTAWQDQAATWRASGITGILPADLVTASGSGLDPHLSPEAVSAQIIRIGMVRKITQDRLRALISEHTEPPLLGILGAARVNVLELNRDLMTLAGGAR
jgi:K+-transporting ATPase ATPase C chain